MFDVLVVILTCSLIIRSQQHRVHFSVIPAVARVNPFVSTLIEKSVKKSLLFTDSPFFSVKMSLFSGKELTKILFVRKKISKTFFHALIFTSQVDHK